MITKVKSIQANGSFENDYGTLQENGKKLLFKFEYEMEDGTIITANHKTQECPFKAGDEVEYEVKKTHPDYGKSGSVKKPETSTYNAPGGSGGGSDVQLMIVRQSSLKVALDLIRHNAIASDSKIEADHVEQLAARFTKWCMVPEAQPDKKEEPKTEAPTPAPAPVVEQPNDDLPF